MVQPQARVHAVVAALAGVPEAHIVDTVHPQPQWDRVHVRASPQPGAEPGRGHKEDVEVQMAQHTVRLCEGIAEYPVEIHRAQVPREGRGPGRGPCVWGEGAVLCGGEGAGLCGGEEAGLCGGEGDGLCGGVRGVRGSSCVGGWGWGACTRGVGRVPGGSCWGGRVGQPHSGAIYACTEGKGAEVPGCMPCLGVVVDSLTTTQPP